MIKAANIKFSYNKDGPLVLKGVNFFMRKGECVALLGGNGSGKSTFIKLFNGLLTGYEGKLSIFNFDPSKEDEIIEIRKRLGMVFQNPENQIVGSIVEDDVAFSLENLGINRSEMIKRIDYALKLTGIHDIRFKQTSDLSGGQTQRLAIASIIAMRPEIIVFDEATSMLDLKSREEIFELILTLNKKEGIGILFITHFMEEAINADRIVVMHDGYIIADDTPNNIFNDLNVLKKANLNMPESKEIAKFLYDNNVLSSWKDVLFEKDLYKKLNIL